MVAATAGVAPAAATSGDVAGLPPLSGGPLVIGHGATAARLPDDRLHLQQGPINLVIGVTGPAAVVPDAWRAALAAFDGLLAGLVAVLPALRSGNPADWSALVAPGVSPVAGAMGAAVAPLADCRFITPMAAVAGAVADRIATAIAAVPGVRRAYVNNGGDIALVLAPGERMTIGVVPSLVRAVPEARLTVGAADPVRGIATSGWDGASYSLGIADAVTVLAASAAAADAAATLIGNAVTVDHPAVRRQPARQCDPDSDLGDRPVTVAVGRLPAAAIAAALAGGLAEARRLVAAGRIRAALIALQGQWRSTDV